MKCFHVIAGNLSRSQWIADGRRDKTFSISAIAIAGDPVRLYGNQALVSFLFLYATIITIFVYEYFYLPNNF